MPHPPASRSSKSPDAAGAQTRLPQVARAQHPPTLCMTEQRARILEAVAHYGVLSRDQIRRLAGYASTNTVNHALRALFHNGYVERRFAPPVVAQPDGDHQALYLLDRKGAEFLAARQGLSDWREVGWNRKENDISWWHLHHRRDTNELIIRLSLGARNAGCRMEWLPERELRRPERRAKVTLPLPGSRSGAAQKQVAVVADAFVVLTPRKGSSLAFFVECDRATVDIATRWQTKLLAYAAFVQSEEYARCFPLPPHAVGVLIVTTGGGQRLASLKAAAERVSRSEFFLFSTMAEIQAANPVNDPVWRICHRPDRHPLLKQHPARRA